MAGKKRHGMTHSPEYRTWDSMRQRCTNLKKKRYRDYGGRGITICARWYKFDLFFEDMGNRPEGTSLDRIDVNGNYEPANCRWATKREQYENMRSNNWVEYHGRKEILNTFLGEFGLSPGSYYYHTVRKGRTPEEAIDSCIASKGDRKGKYRETCRRGHIKTPSPRGWTCKECGRESLRNSRARKRIAK